MTIRVPSSWRADPDFDTVLNYLISLANGRSIGTMTINPRMIADGLGWDIARTATQLSRLTELGIASLKPSPPTTNTMQ